MANEIKAVNDILKLLNDLKSDLTDINKDILQISESALKAGKGFSTIKSPKDLADFLEKSRKASEELNKALKEQESIQKKVIKSEENLIRAKSESNKEIIKNRELTRRTNKEVKEGLLLNDKFASSYEKLSVKHRQAQRTLKNLVAEQQQSGKASKTLNKQIKVAQKEFDVLDKKIRRADNAANDFRRDVGKYKNALQPAVGLLRNLVAAFGVYSALDIASSIFNEIKALNALEEALKVVLKSEVKLNQVQQFLKQTAEENGVEIKGLTKEYTKYLAAIKDSNIEGTKGEKIFRTVVKASSALGNTQAETNGILNALVQMLSKGTIQAEELRGQLGERLPGAFKTMAKALNVTEKELNKMLEQGQLIADEVLPKFADELERTFGLDKVEKIDTLVAAQNRLSNSWTSFVGSLESGSGRLSNTFKFLIDKANTLIKGFERLALSTSEENELLFNETKAKSYAEALREIDKAVAQNGSTREEEAQLTFDANIERFKQLNKEKKLLEERQVLLRKQKEETSVFNSVTYKGINSELEENEEKIARLSISLGIYEGQLSAAQNVLSEYYKTQIDLNKIPPKPPVAPERQKEISVIEKLIKEYESLIEVQKNEVLFNSGIGAAEKQKAVDEINRIKEQIELLKKGIQDDNIALEVPIDFELPDDDELSKYLESQKKKIKQYQDQIKNGNKEAFEEILNEAAKYLDQVANIFQNFSSGRLERIDREIENNQRLTDQQIQEFARTEEEKESIRKQGEAREAKLRQKRIQEERKVAIFEKSLAIARIAINTALEVSKVLSKPFLVGAVIALGAAQTAAVLSTPIPQYKHGKPISDNHEGLAVVGDGGKKEVVYNPKTGYVGVTPSTPTLTHVGKDDIIYPSITAALNSNKLTPEQISNASIMTSLNSQRLPDYNPDAMFDRMLSKFNGKIEKEIKRGFKSQRNNFTANVIVNNNIDKRLNSYLDV